jgi:hypothetical protein
LVKRVTSDGRRRHRFTLAGDRSDRRATKDPPRRASDAEAQPGPPGDFVLKENNVKKIIVGALLSGGIALAGLGLSMGTAYAFDPQPDPPGESVSSPRLNPGVIRGFDPQPDPPALSAPAVRRG